MRSVADILALTAIHSEAGTHRPRPSSLSDCRLRGSDGAIDAIPVEPNTTHSGGLYGLGAQGERK